MQAANNDQAGTGYMCVTGTDSEVATMDDLQFMDAMLDDDGNFVETTESGSTQQLSSISMNSAVPMAPMSQSMNSQQQTIHISDALNQASQQHQVMNNYSQANQQNPNNITQSKAPETSIAAAPTLSTRLNFPYHSNSERLMYHGSGVSVDPQISHPHGAKGLDTIIKSEAGSRKRNRVEAPPVSEDEDDKVKRRMDRNLREQQRSHKITEQISCLRDILASSNVHFKPDKYSTLVSVIDYIKQLQSRSQLLDAEHKNLLNTISKTNEITSGSYQQITADGERLQGNNDLLGDAAAGGTLEDDYKVFVRDLDYRNVFKHCSMALAIASIDGRLIDCNQEFEKLTGFMRNELFPGESKALDTIRADSVPSQSSVCIANEALPKKNLSLFNLLDKEDMEQVFHAMSQMLKQPMLSKEMTVSENDANLMACWNGRLKHKERIGAEVTMNVSLVRSPHGRPKFFQCSLTSAPQSHVFGASSSL